MSERIAISVTISGISRLFGADPSRLLEACVVADAAGIDQIVMPDHLAIGPRTDKYPYGRFPLPPEEPWLEPLTTLAAIAGATSRVRLATGIVIAPLRSALLLAKTAATLDVLSNGRLDLGIGTGWQREEYEAAGVPFLGRTARMDDSIRACRVLWSQAPASFRSRTVSFEDIWCLPHPAQPGGIPIWIGGALTDGNVSRLVEYGSGWMPIGPSPDELSGGVRRLRDAFEASGRDPATLGVRGGVAAVRDAVGKPDLERTLAVIPELAEAGATVASLALAAFARGPDDVRPFFEELGRLTA